jgi:hypothetical protein
MPNSVSAYKKAKPMKSNLGIEEIRWEIVKSMLEEYPSLREKAKIYLETLQAAPVLLQ